MRVAEFPVRVALPLAGLLLLATGSHGVYQALRSRTPERITCEQFHRERPSSRWLVLTDCEVDYVRAGYREKDGRLAEMFFPLRPEGSSPAQPAAIVVATRDPEVLAIAQQTIDRRDAADEEALLVMMLKVVAAMRAAREVEGTTRPWFQLFRMRRDLAPMQAPLAPDFTVLDLHERPNLLYPMTVTTAGALALAGFALLTVRRRRAASLAAQAPPAPPLFQSPDDFRRLMLLNLPPHANPAAIEEAPALGSRATVQDALERVLPGIAFDDSGVAEFSGPGHHIRVDIGRRPEVSTAVVDVTGPEAAVALRRLIVQTGWRAYSPRMGRFIRTQDLAGGDRE